MNKLQTSEFLNTILDKIYNAMDVVDDIDGSEKLTDECKKYLMTAAMDLDRIIDELENDAYNEGHKSGAV